MAPGWWLAGLVFLGAYATFTVGVTGGPNHGEHPLVVALVHLGAFAWRGPELPALSNRLYWGAGVVAIALGALAANLTNNGKAPEHWQLLTRLATAATWGAMFALVVLRPA